MDEAVFIKMCLGLVRHSYIYTRLDRLASLRRQILVLIRKLRINKLGDQVKLTIDGSAYNHTSIIFSSFWVWVILGPFGKETLRGVMGNVSQVTFLEDFGSR